MISSTHFDPPDSTGACGGAFPVIGPSRLDAAMVPEDARSPCRLDTLVVRAVTGDDEALGELLVVVRPQLLSVAARKLPLHLGRCPHQREDFVQECCLAIVVALRDPSHKSSEFRGRSIAEFAAWVGQIADRQVVRDHRRRSAKRRRIPHRLSGLPVESVPDARDRGPQRQVQNSETRSLLRGALERLSAADRQILLLREVEGLSYREIAALTGRSVESLWLQCFRAKAHLRQDPALRRTVGGGGGGERGGDRIGFESFLKILRNCA